MNQLINQYIYNDADLRHFLDAETNAELSIVTCYHPDLIHSYCSMFSKSEMNSNKVKPNRYNLVQICALLGKRLQLVFLARHYSDSFCGQLKETRDYAFYEGKDDELALNLYTSRLLEQSIQTYKDRLNEATSWKMKLFISKAEDMLSKYVQQKWGMMYQYRQPQALPEEVEELRGAIGFVCQNLPDFVATTFQSEHYNDYLKAVSEGFDNVLPYIEARIERQLPGSLHAIVAAKDHVVLTEAVKACSLETVKHVETYCLEDVGDLICRDSFYLIRTAVCNRQSDVVQHFCQGWPDSIKQVNLEEKHIISKLALIYGDQVMRQAIDEYFSTNDFLASVDNETVLELFRKMLLQGNKDNVELIEDKLPYLTSFDPQWMQSLYETLCFKEAVVGLDYLHKHYGQALQSVSIETAYNKALNYGVTPQTLKVVAQQLTQDQIQAIVKSQNRLFIYEQYAEKRQIDKLLNHIANNMPGRDLLPLIKANDWAIYKEAEESVERASYIRQLYYKKYKKALAANCSNRRIHSLKNYFDLICEGQAIRQDIFEKMKQYIIQNDNKIGSCRNGFDFYIDNQSGQAQHSVVESAPVSETIQNAREVQQSFMTLMNSLGGGWQSCQTNPESDQQSDRAAHSTRSSGVEDKDEQQQSECYRQQMT